jgi:hypothetical protein
LSLGWSIEHSRRSDNTEHKQDKSHQSPSQSGIADGSTIKIWARRFFDLSQNRSFVWPPAASRRPGLSRIYFEDEPGAAFGSQVAQLDEARRIAANNAKLPELSRQHNS